MCNVEVQGHSVKSKSCGCPNMATVQGDKITAIDLSQVIIVDGIPQKQSTSFFSNEDIAWQEARKKRKVKKLDFEVR